MKAKRGLLVMAYGTPYEEGDLEAYYTHIRRGRKPSLEMLEDLKARYDAIGGISPLAHITQEQGKALETYLNANQDEIEFTLYIGLKHIHPFIEDAIQSMVQDGIKEAVSIVLAPHYSTFSVKSYNGRAQEEASKYGIALTSIEDWYHNDDFLNYWANELQNIYETMTQEEQRETMVIFSAHSLPEKIIATGDPYPNQLAKTAEEIAKRSGTRNYHVGWQSAGNTGEPWIGPDVQILTEDLYERGKYQTFIYCPVGFVADHLEVLYDNDYECSVVTNQLGVRYLRPPMPNTHPLFIKAMGETVLHAQQKKALKI